MPGAVGDARSRGACCRSRQGQGEKSCPPHFGAGEGPSLPGPQGFVPLSFQIQWGKRQVSASVWCHSDVQAGSGVEKGSRTWERLGEEECGDVCLGIGACVPSERKAVSLPTGHTPTVTVQVTKLRGSSHQAALEGLPEPAASCGSRSTGTCMDSQQLQSRWSRRDGHDGSKATGTNLMANSLGCLCSLPRGRGHGDMGQTGKGTMLQ